MLLNHDVDPHSSFVAGFLTYDVGQATITADKSYSFSQFCATINCRGNHVQESLQPSVRDLIMPSTVLEYKPHRKLFLGR